MAMKEFDFKSFLIQRGELVGLGVAVLVGLILVFVGSKGFFAGSAKKTVEDIQKKKSEAKSAIANSTPPDDLKHVPSSLKRTLDVTKIDPQVYELASNFVTPTPVEDMKSRNPVVLPPTDFDVQVLGLAFPGLLLDKEANSIWVVTGKDITQNLSPGNLAGRVSRGMAGSGPGGDERGSGDIVGGGPGMEMGPGAFGPGQAPNARQRTPRLVELTKLGNNPNTKYVEQLYPYHVAVVSGAFPLEQQLENFRRSLLRKGTMNDLFAAINSGKVSFQFVGLDIERRVTLPSGRIKDFTEKDQGWKNFTEDYRREVSWLYPRTERAAARWEPEDPELFQFGMIREGLAVPRPMIARDGKYPTNEKEIPSIRDALNDLQKAIAQKKRPLANPFSRRFKNPTFDPFSPTSSLGAGGGDTSSADPGKGVLPFAGGPEVPGTGPEAGKTPQEELLIPKHVLVRFLDLTVQPGHSYQYRVRVKMANPNYGRKDTVAYDKLAETKELPPSALSKPTSPARVPDTLFYYAVNEKSEKGGGWQIQGDTGPATPAATPIQVHRWLSNIPGDRDNAVANWVILERALVHRGENVGREEHVEVPVWDYVQEMDVLAASRKGKSSQQKVPIDFRVRASNEARSAILVDFEGPQTQLRNAAGRLFTIEPTAAAQLLVMAPDGRLVARNSHEDTEDKTRTEVHAAWRKWIKEAREGPRGGKMFDGGLLPRPGKGGGN